VSFRGGGAYPRFHDIGPDPPRPPSPGSHMRLSDLTWPATARLAPTHPIIFPIAAVEQHGRHLPLFTDTFLLDEVLRRALAKLAEPVVVAPTLWLGNSHHHLDYAGTLSASPRAYLDLLGDLIENALIHGFRRIVLLNGHGGNIVPAAQAIFEARQRHRERADLLLLSATYWQLAEDAPAGELGLAQEEMGHACEWETSMIMRLRPDLVGPVGEIDPVPQGEPFRPATRGWITRDRSPIGHIGTPSAADPGKGELLFERFSTGVAAWLGRVARWDGAPWTESPHSQT
jgi:creatinine amidohydrolase